MVGAGSQLAAGIVLARLLSPADFGVMALAFVVLGLVRPMGDFGIGNALVQRANLTDRHIRTAVSAATLLGIVTAAAIALAAPLGTLIMQDPRVAPVLRLLSLGFAIQGVSVVASALLRRRLDFRKQFFIDTGSYLIGYAGVSIVLAVMGFGVWSLVWGGLAQVVLSTTALVATVDHPMRPLLARKELSELLHFGAGAAGVSWVNYIALNGDNFIVGRLMGAASLGLYNRAYTLMNIPYTYAANVMSAVLFPAFAEVQGEPRRLGQAYLLTTQLTALIAAPAMCTLAIVAPNLVPALYGSRWLGVVVPLQILCGAGYFRALYHLGGIVAHSVGRVYSDLRNQMVYAALVVGGAIFGARSGLAGVSVGVAVAIVFMFFASSLLALRATGTPWSLYLRSQTAALLTAAIVSAAALGTRRLLELTAAPDILVAAAVLAAAAVPWGISMLWQFGQPQFDGLRAELPAWVARLVERFRSLAGRDAS